MLNNSMNAPRRSRLHGNVLHTVRLKRWVCLIQKTAALFFIAAVIGVTDNVSAAVLYSTVGSTYSENFNDSLPTTTNPFNSIAIQFNGTAHIQNGNAPWSGGWKDDSATDATNLGIPGWYLWSDVTTLTTATGGANGHVQFRYGGGSPGTPGTGFFAFSATTPNDSEKALGIHSAAAFTDSASGRRSYIGLQLINNTTETLHSFSITYDGEQYREAAGTTAADGFDLQWSLVSSAAGWHDSPTSGGFYNNGVSGVDYGGVADSFKSPINSNAGALNLNGNLAANRVADIAETVAGINWLPGTQLWIRWRDQFTHDGIAIDNVRFTASTEVPEPSALLQLAPALLCCVCRRR